MPTNKDLINSLRKAKQHLNDIQAELNNPSPKLDQIQPSLKEANDGLEQVLKDLIDKAESEDGDE
jgi:CRISPR/Cas system CSM-associated protein Csm2 small subunit